MPKSRPIVITGDEARAILNGGRTVLGRTIEPQPIVGRVLYDISRGESRFGKPGDLLWAKTPWRRYAHNTYNEQAWDPYTRKVRWKLIDGKIEDCEPEQTKGWREMPAHSMPKWASIIRLRVKTNVAVLPASHRWGWRIEFEVVTE